MSASKKLIVLVLFVIPFTATGASDAGNISNSDFELSKPSLYGPFDAPKDWNCLNYTEVVSSFNPEDYPPEPGRGNYENWRVDSLVPVSGEYFLLLSTGHLSDKPRYQLSYVSQLVEFEAGTKLSGYYFFGTYDYPTYFDRGAVELVPEKESGGYGDKEVVVSKNVNEVGEYSSMEGWEYFEYAFDEENAGRYKLRIEVNDVGDGIFNSYFAVDDLKVCPSGASGNLNDDCVVNFLDFVILAQHWFDDCSGITWCEQRNGKVDYEELANMSQNWLGGDYSYLCPTVKEGNFNSDCRVDFCDVARLCRDWLKDCSEVEWCTKGVIDSAYLNKVGRNWLAGRSID